MVQLMFRQLVVSVVMKTITKDMILFKDTILGLFLKNHKFLKNLNFFIVFPPKKQHWGSFLQLHEKFLTQLHTSLWSVRPLFEKTGRSAPLNSKAVENTDSLQFHNET
jgi:hypothetical protein